MIAQEESSALIPLCHHYFYHLTPQFCSYNCCVDLLHNAGASAPRKGKFSPGQPVKYWLDNVVCEGNEESLFDCPRRGRARTIGIHNCRRGERAGVQCLSRFIFTIMYDVIICLLCFR